MKNTWNFSVFGGEIFYKFEQACFRNALYTVVVFVDKKIYQYFCPRIYILSGAMDHQIQGNCLFSHSTPQIMSHLTLKLYKLSGSVMWAEDID